MVNNTRVVIIGAGPAGIALGACLKQQGIDFVILERSDQIGNSWRNHYHRLHLHTAKGFSGLPFMPFPADYPRFPTRQQVIDYLEAYAKHFQLVPQFNQKVTSVTPQNGRWQTQTADATYTSDFVVVATGLNQVPKSPALPDQEQFKGQILHSAGYTTGELYRNQNVLIVGFGNSGAEIALDAYEQGANVGISVRGPVNVVFLERFGIPVQLLTILMSPLPPRVVDMLTAPVLMLTIGDLTRYGLQKPSYGAAEQIQKDAKIPVIDPGVISKIKQRKIKVYSGIERLTETGVVFTDGTAQPFDVIVLATGFKTNLNTLLPNYTDDAQALKASTPGLYFCGFKNPATGLLREIAIEAQQISKEIAAKIPVH
ncbi:MAG: NAD(P)/FAD-dependent oxidoreductase [Anaerolineae bacterium]|nr:NAD(P)/FAD-dependent oxidoreductase [Anaerolineae bacterium]